MLGDAGAQGDASVDTSDKANSEWLTVSGSGTSVTGKFELAAGTCRVHATLQLQSDFDGFIVQFYPSSDKPDFTINELIEEAEEWTAQATRDAPVSGHRLLVPGIGHAAHGFSDLLGYVA